MEDMKLASGQLIVESYQKYFHSIRLFAYQRINNWETAEDLVLDVFLRLIDYKQMLRPETVKCFIYTIASNLITDYLRVHYRKQEYTTYIYDSAASFTNEVESRIVADDLLGLERTKLRMLPMQRRRVYVMSRFEEKTIAEISVELCLSARTVENHLRISRKEIREFIRQCI